MRQLLAECNFLFARVKINPFADVAVANGIDIRLGWDLLGLGRRQSRSWKMSGKTTDNAKTETRSWGFIISLLVGGWLGR